MRAQQIAPFDELLDIAFDDAVGSVVATASAAHLKAVLLGELLERGATVVEPAAQPRTSRTLRTVDGVIRIDRVPQLRIARPAGAGRAPRVPDLQVG